MEKEVIHARLKASENDCGYITYVFDILDQEQKNRLQAEYIMCVRYPNWEHENIEIGSIGFLSIIEVLAGIDKYYKESEFIPYKYNNVQFIKFVKESKKRIDGIITLD